MHLVILEDKSVGYRNRTIKNASADATIAFAIDFNTAGEKLTKSAVLNQYKLYIKVDITDLIVPDSFIDDIVDKFNVLNIKTLNIAGNGIYTLKKLYTQDQVDNFIYIFLDKLLNNKNLKTKIKGIRTGGQSGGDESGAKAALKLNIPLLILAPKGFKFRNIDGNDICDEKLFKQRFI